MGVRGDTHGFTWWVGRGGAGLCLLLAISWVLAACTKNTATSGGAAPIVPSAVIKTQPSMWAQIPQAVRTELQTALLQPEYRSYRNFQGNRPDSCAQLWASRYHVYQLTNPYTGNAVGCNSTPAPGDVDYALGTGEDMILKHYVQAPGGAVATEQNTSSVTMPQGVSSMDWLTYFHTFVWQIYDRQYVLFCDVYWRRPASLAEFQDPTMIPQPTITDPRSGNGLIVSDDPTPAPFKVYIEVSTGRFAVFDANSQYASQTEDISQVFGKLGNSSRFLSGAAGLPAGTSITQTGGMRPGGG